MLLTSEGRFGDDNEAFSYLPNSYDAPASRVKMDNQPKGDLGVI